MFNKSSSTHPRKNVELVWQNGTHVQQEEGRDQVSCWMLRAEIKVMRQLSGGMTGKTQMFTQHMSCLISSCSYPSLSLSEGIQCWPLRLCGWAKDQSVCPERSSRIVTRTSEMHRGHTACGAGLQTRLYWHGPRGSQTTAHDDDDDNTAVPVYSCESGSEQQEQMQAVYSLAAAFIACWWLVWWCREQTEAVERMRECQDNSHNMITLPFCFCLVNQHAHAHVQEKRQNNHSWSVLYVVKREASANFFIFLFIYQC